MPGWPGTTSAGTNPARGNKPGRSESVLADALKMDVSMTVEKRGYGIYTAPVFVATVKLDGQFRAQDIAQFRRGSDAPWQATATEPPTAIMERS